MKENKAIKPVYLNGWKRLFSSLLNLLISIALSFLFDYAFIAKSVKSIAHYDDLYAKREEENNRYQELQDEYGIYYYDSESNRLANESVSKEVESSFLNNEEVIKLKEDILNKDRLLVAVQLEIIGFSFLLGSLIGFTFSHIVFGVGRGLGELVFHDDMTDEKGYKLKFSKVLLYGFLRWVFYVVLGVITVFILPIIFFKVLYYDDKHQSPLDKWMKIEHRLNEKYQ